MMRAHLAAIRGINLTHFLLDERVTRLGKHWFAAQSINDLKRIPGQSRVMDDACAGLTGEKAFRQKTDEIIAFDKSTGFIEKETAIKITNPRQPHVRTGFHHSLRGRDAVGLQHGVRHAVRESAIGGVIEFHELKRQMRLEQIDEQPCSAVAGIHNNFQFAQCLPVDVPQEMIDIPLLGINRSPHARG